MNAFWMTLSIFNGSAVVIPSNWAELEKARPIPRLISGWFKSCVDSSLNLGSTTLKIFFASADSSKDKHQLPLCVLDHCEQLCSSHIGQQLFQTKAFLWQNDEHEHLSAGVGHAQHLALKTVILRQNSI